MLAESLVRPPEQLVRTRFDGACRAGSELDVKVTGRHSDTCVLAVGSGRELEAYVRPGAFGPGIREPPLGAELDTVRCALGRDCGRDVPTARDRDTGTGSGYAIGLVTHMDRTCASTGGDRARATVTAPGTVHEVILEVEALGCGPAMGGRVHTLSNELVEMVERHTGSKSRGREEPD
jgi:hypothetical protein